MVSCYIIKVLYNRCVKYILLVKGDAENVFVDQRFIMTQIINQGVIWIISRLTSLYQQFCALLVENYV